MSTLPRKMSPFQAGIKYVLGAFEVVKFAFMAFVATEFESDINFVY